MASEVASVVVAGGRNQVCAFLIPRLLSEGSRVTAISRGARPSWIESHPDLDWQQVSLANADLTAHRGAMLVYLAPMTLLPGTLNQLMPSRVVLMSSTSRFSKADSSSPAEQGVAAMLQRGELELTRWSQQQDMPATILRPTLIYGAGLDQNLTRMARLIKRFGFALIAGAGNGKRQPVHADDLADAILKALRAPASFGRDYNLSGGSTLSYREMLERVFASVDRKPRIIRLPTALLRPAAVIASRLPGLVGLSPQVFARMEQDLVFDHQAAIDDFGYQPREFSPTSETWQLPKSLLGTDL